MENEMNTAETIRTLAEENQTRKILEMVKESENLEEAIKKIKALLEK